MKLDDIDYFYGAAEEGEGKEKRRGRRGGKTGGGGEGGEEERRKNGEERRHNYNRVNRQKLTQCFRLRVGGGNTGREWAYTRKWLSQAFPVELPAVKILKQYNYFRNLTPRDIVYAARCEVTHLHWRFVTLFIHYVVKTCRLATTSEDGSSSNWSCIRMSQFQR